MVGTLNARVLEAKAIASLSKVETLDKLGRVKTVITPASQATQNQVIIRRFTGGLITVECRKCAGHNGYNDCKGNYVAVCRHSLAAIYVSMAAIGYQPRFRTDKASAEKLHDSLGNQALNANGIKVFELVSHQGNHAKLYMVAEKMA